MSVDAVSSFNFPEPVGEPDIHDICTWLIRVMDKKDKSVVFVASILTYYLKNGGISSKQYDSLQRVYDRVSAAFRGNRLEIQGCIVAQDDGAPANIVTFSRSRNGRA